MSEELIKNSKYTENVIFDRYTCLSIGETNLNSLINSGVIKCKNDLTKNKIKNKKPDLLILDSDKTVTIYVEVKQPINFNNDEKIEKTIKEQLDSAKAVGAKIFVVTDCSKYKWINPLTGNFITDEKGKDIDFNINPKDPKNAINLSNLINDIIISIDSKNDQILAKKYQDPTDLAIRINKILKRLTFSSTKMSLYTFVEIFLFKYLSDIQILTNKDSFDHIIKLYKSDENAEVLNHYLTVSRKKMKILFPASKQDGTTIINGDVFHVEQDEEGNWISPDSTDKIFRLILEQFEEYEKLNGKFINISKDFKSKLFETFMKNSDEKSEMGQFFTPLKVVQEMVNLVKVKSGDTVCDPSCGVGKFLFEATKDDYLSYYTYDPQSKILDKNIILEGMDKMMSEKDDITIVLAKANLLIYFSKLFTQNKNTVDIKKISEQLLSETFSLKKSLLGTLESITPNKYDVIYANPPYYRNQEITQLANNLTTCDNEKIYSYGGSGIEAIFMEWIMKSLNYGGKATIVLPDGFFSTSQNSPIKEMLKMDFFIHNIISLPRNTFFNTPKKTYILTIEKKPNQTENGHKIIQDFPVFSYICNSIGETLDTNRLPILDDNDLHVAVCKYNRYKNDYDHIMENEDPMNLYADIKKDILEDPKLKLIDIEELTKEKSWIVENWWSDKEKINIGISKSVNKVSIKEFGDELYELNEMISGFMGDIECL
jgi:type I restriction-modification system DNA methylase subunit